MGIINDNLKSIENLVVLDGWWIKILTTEFIRISIVDKYVPHQNGQLQKSAVKWSNYNEGVVRWNTDYAWDVYEFNLTGVSEWDIKEWEDYRNDFEELVSNAFEEKSRQILKNGIEFF